jgi:hypothetical protein
MADVSSRRRGDDPLERFAKGWLKGPRRVQRRVIGKLDVFTHGFINSSVIPNLGDGIVVGAGGLYTSGERLSLSGSYDAGLTVDAPTTSFLLGFAAAF